MAAPKGNQFWKLRSKHGRDRLFASPELLWEAACEYFEWCDKHPWEKVDFKGKPLEEVRLPTARPYTITGLCLYLGCGVHYFDQFEKAYPNLIRMKVFRQSLRAYAKQSIPRSLKALPLGLTTPTL